MVFNWNDDKNSQLRKERQISFERVVVAIESGDLIDVLEHPDVEKYPDQIIILVRADEYVYAVPTLIRGDEFFLKTVYPSRKYTDMYLPGKRRWKA